MKRKTMVGALSVAATIALVATGCSQQNPGGQVAGSAGSDAGERVTWRVAMNQTDDHPITVAVNQLADRVSERTDGRFTIDVFSNEALGTQPETLQLVSDNTLELAIITAPHLENLNSDFLVFNMPLVFDDIDHQMRVINDAAITDELYASLEASNNLSVVGGFTGGVRSLYATTPITGISDMAAKKIRVQESDTHVRMIELMGGAATPMAFGELYTALQAGVIDGAENNEVSYVNQRHFEVAPYFAFSRHLIIPDYLVASASALAKLSAEDRAIFDEEFAGAVDAQVAGWNSATAEAIAQAEAAGATFTELDADEFQKAIRPLVDASLTSDLMRSVYDATRAKANG